MMINIDVHADDYGLTINASKRILELVSCKKITGISVVPNMSAFEKSLRIWKNNYFQNKELRISVHLNFMEGYCLSNPKDLSFLVDNNGLFNVSWYTLVKYNYSFKIRNLVKKQLKLEIKEQIMKVVEGYGLLEGKKLRIDSHQHTHMIPMVMESLSEVISENDYPVEYIRLSKDPWLIYLCYPKFYHSYQFINIIKVAVLNWYSYKDQRILRKMGIPPMLLSGVFLSGKMDKDRIKILYPAMKKYAEKRDMFFEILFHPGEALEEEMKEEFNHTQAKKFYLSPNRQEEYKAVLDIF